MRALRPVIVPDPGAPGTALTLRDVSKVFGGERNLVHALDRVSLEVRRGELDRKSTRLNSSH